MNNVMSYEELLELFPANPVAESCSALFELNKRTAGVKREDLSEDDPVLSEIGAVPKLAEGKNQRVYPKIERVLDWLDSVRYLRERAEWGEVQ